MSRIAFVSIRIWDSGLMLHGTRNFHGTRSTEQAMSMEQERSKLTSVVENSQVFHELCKCTTDVSERTGEQPQRVRIETCEEKVRLVNKKNVQSRENASPVTRTILKTRVD
jgi:hypothetical protein